MRRRCYAKDTPDVESRSARAPASSVLKGGNEKKKITKNEEGIVRVKEKVGKSKMEKCRK